MKKYFKPTHSYLYHYYSLYFDWSLHNGRLPASVDGIVIVSSTLYKNGIYIKDHCNNIKGYSKEISFVLYSIECLEIKYLNTGLVVNTDHLVSDHLVSSEKPTWDQILESVECRNILINL